MSTDTRRFRRVGVMSPTMLRTANIDLLLGELADEAVVSPRGEGCDAIAGWGYKTVAGLAAARLRGLPYIAIEDGFFRSVGSPTRKPPPLGFVIDDVGVYYRTSHESRLSRMLDRPEAEAPGPAVRQEAGDLLNFVRAHRLTKYNSGTDTPPEIGNTGGRPVVLVVDQVYGDKSVSMGGAAPETFATMIRTALERWPDSRILVKSHPDPGRGRVSGYLQARDWRDDRITFLARNHTSWALFDVADIVLVATSALGFEALIAGKEVHCFGRPFYAGRGLTEDHSWPGATQSSGDRRPSVTLESLFAAACVEYSRYVSPFERRICPAREGLALLAELKARTSPLLAGPCVALKISRWKRPSFEAFIPEADKPVRYVRSHRKAVRLAARRGAALVCWASKMPEALPQDCAREGVRLVRVEDGFIRSRGLGAAHHEPLSLAFDFSGIYYDAASPGDLAAMLAASDFSPELRARAARLREAISRAGITKYNLPAAQEALGEDLPPPEEVHLVVGQVDDDASVRKGGNPAIPSSVALLAEVRRRHPDAYIVYKPHPDVLDGFRKGCIRSDEASRYCDKLVLEGGMEAWFARAGHVHVLSSLAGFEALIRGLRVYCYGRPFYAGRGLTEDAGGISISRCRRLSLDEMVAGALICYPRYRDPVSGLLCTPETVVERLAQGYEGKAVRRMFGWSRDIARCFRKNLRGTG